MICKCGKKINKGSVFAVFDICVKCRENRTCKCGTKIGKGSKSGKYITLEVDKCLKFLKFLNLQ